MAANCQSRAPATKNIVNAVTAMTVVVPRSGSRKTRATTGTVMRRNGIVPARRLPIRVPREAIQWAR